MPEPKLYKELKDIGLKFMSNIVSFKYQTGIVVSIAFFMGLVPWYAWLPALMAIASIRGYEKFLIWGKRTPEVEEDTAILPEPTIAEE